MTFATPEWLWTLLIVPVAVACRPFETVVNEIVDVVLLFHTILPVNGPVLVPFLPRPAHVAPLLRSDAVSVPPVTPPPVQPLSVALQRPAAAGHLLTRTRRPRRRLLRGSRAHGSPPTSRPS